MPPATLVQGTGKRLSPPEAAQQRTTRDNTTHTHHATAPSSRLRGCNRGQHRHAQPIPRHKLDASAGNCAGAGAASTRAPRAHAHTALGTQREAVDGARTQAHRYKPVQQGATSGATSALLEEQRQASPTTGTHMHACEQLSQRLAAPLVKTQGRRAMQHTTRTCTRTTFLSPQQASSNQTPNGARLSSQCAGVSLTRTAHGHAACAGLERHSFAATHSLQRHIAVHTHKTSAVLPADIPLRCLSAPPSAHHQRTTKHLNAAATAASPCAPSLLPVHCQPARQHLACRWTTQQHPRTRNAPNAHLRETARSAAPTPTQTRAYCRRRAPAQPHPR